VIHVPGRSTLADLSAKSHPRSRLAALRRMWSIEGIDNNDDIEKTPKGLSSSDERTSGDEMTKVRINMIRVRALL
jgi:hypothetical protein